MGHYGSFDPSNASNPDNSYTVELVVRDHPKCEDLVIVLREMVAYENRTTAGKSLREDVQTDTYIFRQIIVSLQAISKLLKLL